MSSVSDMTPIAEKEIPKKLYGEKCSTSHTVEKDFPVGSVIWGKFGFKWWPAIVVNPSECECPPAKLKHSWVFWLGDHKFSQVSHHNMLHFALCFSEKFKIPSSKLRRQAIIEALEILANSSDVTFQTPEDLIKWAKDAFGKFQFDTKELSLNSSRFVMQHLIQLKNKKNKMNVEGTSESSVPSSSESSVPSSSESSVPSSSESSVPSSSESSVPSSSESSVPSSSESNVPSSSESSIKKKVISEDEQNMKIADEEKNSSEKNFPVGAIVWGKIGSKWWPAITINPSDCGRSPAKFGHLWLFWLGDYKFSEIPLQKIVDFMTCFSDMVKNPSSKLRHKAIIEALELLASSIDKSFSDSKDLFTWAKNGFENFQVNLDAITQVSSKFVLKHLTHLKRKVNQEESNESVSHFLKISRRPSVTEEIEKRKIPDIVEDLSVNSAFKDFSIGTIIWGRFGSKWWPAVIIDPKNCRRDPAKIGHSWVFWFGDHKVSELAYLKMLHFMPCFHEVLKRPPSKLHRKGVIEALEILARVADKLFTSSEDLFQWAKDGFHNVQIEASTLSSATSQFVIQHLPVLKLVTNEDKGTTRDDESNGVTNEDEGTTRDDESDETLKEAEEFFQKLQSGNLNIEEICIACHRNDETVVLEHPFFLGKLCISCEENVKEAVFALGDDGKHICCIICFQPGFLIVCESVNCPKSYCHSCAIGFFGSTVTNQIIDGPGWLCLFCSSNGTTDCLLKTRSNWEQKLSSLFNLEIYDTNEITNLAQKKPITVLSLFDGISTGKLVLDMLGISINKYYASEINRDAINVSKFHYKDSITYLGDVRMINEEVIDSLDKIDLVIGGSPCNDLSLVNPARKGIYDMAGTGCLFFDFFHILSIVKKKNPSAFYLFENVASMLRKDKLVISSFLSHEPAVIDAKYFSPQTRCRNFWGNIPGLHSLPKFWNSLPSNALKENVLSDFILPHMGRRAVVEKIKTVTTQRNSLIQAQCTVMPVDMNGEPDILWITELEKIFGFPCHYTDIGNLGIQKRRELLGRSWSVPVIKTILQPLKTFFACK